MLSKCSNSEKKCTVTITAQQNNTPPHSEREKREEVASYV